MASTKAAYFVFYNTALAAGWFYVLVLCLVTLREKGLENVYPVVEFPLQIAQTAAVMEIVHSLIGLVRSPISATLPQVLSRLFLVWGVLYPVPEVRTSPFLISLIVSWCIAEVVRYTFFALKEIGSVPSFLLWLRYSMFIVLYPSGITSEVALAYLALPYIKAHRVYSLDMPNPFNFAIDYYIVCILILASYIPGSPYLYTYMLGQRKKVLAKKDKSA